MSNNNKYAIAAANAYSLADMCRNLNLVPRGANFDTMKHKIAFYNIDVSHFKNKVVLHDNHGKARQGKKSLKRSIINLRGHQCEVCANKEWMNSPITLELEHVDGDNTNNVKENLLLLCPNCHSQTSTWKRGKNSFIEKVKHYCPCGNEKKTLASKHCAQCAHKLNAEKMKLKSIENNNGALIKNSKKPCGGKDCDKDIKYTSTFCPSCARKKENKIKLPSYEVISALIQENSLKDVAKKLGISYNALQKYLSSTEKIK